MARARRYALVTLLSLVTLNAIGGGIYGLAGAKDVPTAWLAGSPFADYTIPSIILLVVVGGAFGLAAVLALRATPRAHAATAAAAAVLLGWLGTQVAIIGFVSFLQPLMAVVACAAFLLAWWPDAPDPTARSTAERDLLPS
jgi:hypothetical protein